MPRLHWIPMLAVAAWTSWASADDGAIPVWAPITITQPGRYVLTRDVVSATNPVITISALDATLDLNGFTVEGTSGPFVADVILVNSASSVTIENGTVVGGGAGIRLSTSARQFALRNLAIRGGRTGIGVAASGSVGRIEDTLIESVTDTGISAGGSAIQIRRNVINLGNLGGKGIALENCKACVAAENTVQSATDVGILVNQGSGNLVLGNTVSSSGTGLRVTNGGYHQLEGNVLTGNTGLGMWLRNTSSGVVYRRNTARNNGGPGSCAGSVVTADLCDEGSGNTSHGDNYMPNLR